MRGRSADEALGGVAAVVTSRPKPVAASQAVDAAQWRSRIGIELYTVRDLLTADYEGTLAKVADIGYTEVEPTSYNNMSPKEFRAMLDRLKLTMSSTHAPARGTGADLVEGRRLRHAWRIAPGPGCAARRTA